MSGIDWRDVGRDDFEKIANALLGREYGSRGHAVNGRGGDAGIDYDVDDTKIIFQYKFFPEGIPSEGTRRNQVKRSFKAALQHDPDEWILVVPAALTPPERRFVSELGKGKRVKVSVRDETWFTDQLSKHKDLAEHFRWSSDLDYLHARAEAFRFNPIIRNPDDLDERLRDLRQDVDRVDPDWTWDVHMEGGRITRFLRAKDPCAAERSPITIGFTAQVDSASPLAVDLANAQAFGVTKPVRLTADMVTRFAIGGPPIVGEANPHIELLVMHPAPTDAPWQPSELRLTGADGQRIGTYLAETRPLAQGIDGVTVQARIGHHIQVAFRLPFSNAASGSADLDIGDLSGAPAAEAFEAADFMVGLDYARAVEIFVGGTLATALDLSTRRVDRSLTDGFSDIRSVAADLRAIEAQLPVRFRYPRQLNVVERIMIRNLQLMLAGHCVIHPTADAFNGTFNGETEGLAEQVLTTAPHWLLYATEIGHINLLGQTIQVPNLTYAAVVQLTEDQLAAARNSLAASDIAGQPISFPVRAGDRLRMFIGDRFPSDQPIDFTDWNLPGIRQLGLRTAGQPPKGLQGST
ncbi:hypothetical protein EV138_6483 [Kribbella voronezhensis]|uniref:Restriction endonuclease n=1 Tax=Kribbella voronezhensis TaxID=2512212 RepID=A0A4R7SYA4_9ACTN|nr:hypothetical protein [Kribbella voronezhensis]TDU84015.1 hypothetical protein EV138_6483 [Kribbella voronezhensis]